MNENYPKAYREVNEILKYVPVEDVNKIPKEVLDAIEKNMDSNYEFSLDESKDFSEQDLLLETKAILANIFYDYWATDFQKEKIKEIRRIEYNVLEEQKKEKYKDLDIFAQNKKSKEVNNEQEMIQPEILPVEVHKNIFEKIFDYIKSIFKKDK